MDMENGPPCKKKMCPEELLQGTSLALNFVTYQEYNTLKIEHEQMKSQLHAVNDTLMLHKKLFDELDAVKKENSCLKKEITNLKRVLTKNHKDGDVNSDLVESQSDYESSMQDLMESNSAKSSSSNPPVPCKETLSFLKSFVSYYDDHTSPVPELSKSLSKSLSKPDLPPAPLLSQSIDDVNWDQSNVLTPNKPTPDDCVYSQRVQLLPVYNIWVNRSKLHALLQEAETAGNQGPVVVLRRIMMLVFSIEEMAHSRGQGIMHKSTDNVQLMHREPLDPVKVQACKDYMRKWCTDHGQVEPTDKVINSVITHQITYARTKLKRMANKLKNSHMPASLDGGDYYRDDFSSCQDEEECRIKEEMQ